MSGVKVSIYRPGTKVQVDNRMDGHILQVCISPKNHITYQVEWWDGANRKVEWLEEFALSVFGSSKYTIGFHSGSDIQ